MPTAPEDNEARFRPPEPGRAMACVGCLAALVVAGLAALLLFAISSRRSVPPVLEEWTQRQECTQHLTELTQALRRYHNRYQEYPAKLTDLAPEFLAHPRTLRCPLDRSPMGQTAYAYTRPAPEALGNTVVIRCRQHKGLSEGVMSVLEIRLDGSLEVRNLPEALPPPSKG